jgi:hypothetical protein
MQPVGFRPEGRSASGDMKSERTMTQSPAKTSKMSRIRLQKIAPAPFLRNRTDFFSGLLDLLMICLARKL